MTDSAEKLAEIGRCYKIGHDGFVGTVIGHYTTLEGKEGVVLQQVGTKVVHVYGRKWIDEEAALSASGTKSDGGGEVADPQKPEIGSVEFRGKKSLGALPGSCAPTADATALPSSDGVAPIPSDLKRGEIFSFDDGLLTIKISGYGREDGWGTLAFHDSQIEIDADGFHCVEIAPSELREIRDFLNRVTKPGPSDPIPSPSAPPLSALTGASHD